MTPKQFIKKENDGYIAGDYTPKEVYSYMEGYARLKILEDKLRKYTK